MKRQSNAASSARPKRRKLTRILIGLAVVAAALVALGPTIAGPIARPLVEGAVNDRIKGRASLKRLGLSWFGAQRVALSLDDPDGGRVADVSVRADRGLLGLALGSRRLGIVYVRGSATIVRDADGGTNLQRAIEARFPVAGAGGGGAGEPAALPTSLAASLVLDGLEVVYQDAALAEQTGGTIGAVRLGALTGSVDFAVGSPLGVTIKGPIATGRDVGGLGDSGSLDLEARVTGLTDAAGRLTLDALGADLTLLLRAPAIDAVVHAGFADGALTRTGETRVTINATELAAIVPKVAEALAARPGVEITQLPSLTLALEEFRLPTGGDLRTSSGALRLTTTPIVGLIELPAGGTPTASAFAIEALEMTLSTPSLAGTLTLAGGTHATIGEASAGALSVDLTVGGLLDEAGAFRAGVPGTAVGGVRVEGFSTPILQPLVAAINTALPTGLRLDLPEDLGPKVDLALSAASHTDGSGAYDIDLTLDADHAEVDAAIVVRGQRVASRGGGVRARVAPVAPILDRLAAAYGVRVSRGGEVVFQAGEFAIDLAKLGSPGGPDLRGTRAAFDLTLTNAVGRAQLAGDDVARDFNLARLALGVATDDLAGEVRLTSDASGRFNGKPFASMKTDITLAGLLDAAGAPRKGGLPTFRGEVRVDGIELDTVDKVFGSLYADSGLVLVQDLGPRADILLLGASNPAAGPDATDIDLTFRSSRLDITAPLTATTDRLRSREPIIVVDRAAGSSLSRLLAGKGPATFRPTGALRVAIAGLEVPMGVGGVRPDAIGASITVTLTGFVADIPLVDADRKPLPPGLIAMPELVASLTATPGSPPSLAVDGRFVHADQPFTLALTSTLHGLFLDAPADAADPMSVLAPGNLTPETSLRLVGLPATLARLVPRGMAMIGDKPLDVVLLSRDTLGRTFDLTVETSPNPEVAGTSRYSIGFRGENATVDVAGGFARDRVRMERAGVRLGVTPRVASYLTALLAADAPVKPTITEPARLGFELNKPFEISLSESFAPDLAKLPGVIDARVTLDAALAELILPAAEGATAMVIPPVRVKGLAINLSAPKAAMREKGGTAIATLAGVVLAADGSTLVNLSGRATAAVKNSRLEGAVPVTLKLGGVAAPWIDELLGKPALVAGMLGDRFDVTVNADPDLFVHRDPNKVAASLTIESPRFSSSAPIDLALSEQTAFLRNPVSASWVMGSRWANLYFLGAAPGGAQPAFSLTEQTPVRLDVTRLALAIGEGNGLFKPGLFIVDATATVPDLASKLGDGRDLRVGGLQLRIARGPTPDQLGFVLTVPRMKIGDQPEVKPDKSQITGRVASFTDASGNLTPDAARLNISGGLAPIPTDVIDALARQNGLLRDALGPTVDLTLDAQDFSRQGGTLLVKAVTPLASATIKGKVADGLFIVDPKASPIEVSVITPALARRFQKALPFVATLEKTRDDEPLRVIFETPLALPLDGNMDRLNGKVTIAIGTARFGTSDWFQKLLAITQQKTAGEVGRRMPPLKVTVVDGLVSYEPFAMPFGEFKLETQGFINLSSKPRPIGGDKPLPAGQLEVLTFIPAGAFAAEAVPALASIPIPVIGNLARLPVRTSGLIAKPSNKVAADLVGKEAVNELVQPGKLLDDLLGGLRKDK